MMPAAKHFDPVLGVDIHIIQPPGPVPPVPIPHPFVGFLIDPMDYVPIVGATVKVNGLYRAQSGTAGKCMPPHIPIGGVFVKPPSNECEMFMGSSTVLVNGEPFSYLALPALSCQDIGMPSPPRMKKKSKIKSLLLPTSVVLPIPAGPPVLVGGPPTISLMGLAIKLGMAGLLKGLKKLAKTKVFKRLTAAAKKAKRRAFKNMKPGFLKCKVLKAEPVDITTGENVVEQQDFELRWPLPLTWTRRYTSRSTRMGLCGYGWDTPADARLEFESDGAVLFYDGTAGSTLFQSLPDHGPVRELVDGATLRRAGRHLQVRLKSGLTYHFGALDWGPTEYLVERITDLCGNSLTFRRDAGALREIISNVGPRLEVVSQAGRVHKLILHHPLEGKPRAFVRYEYSKDGDLREVYDALQNPYRFFYRNHCLTRHTDRNGLSFYYEFDHYTPEGRVLHSWGDGGLYNYQFKYDTDAGLVHITDSLGHTSVVELNDLGLPVSETDPLGGVTQFEYDEVGRTNAVIDADGLRTEYQYDECGNLLNLTRPDGTSIHTEFNAASKAVKITDPNGTVWQQEWNAQGLLTRQISPLSAEVRYDYDSHGQPVAFTNARGARTRLELDKFGNPIRLVDALGHLTEFSYDAFGNVIAKVDALRQRTLYAYDPKGRLSEAVLPSGAAVGCRYDAQDDLTHYRDENGTVTELEYFGLGEIKRRRQPHGHTIEYHYDTEERLIGVTNQRGERYELRRDALGRIIEEVDYWGQSRRYSYTPSGRLRESVDPLGRRIRFETDPLGRILKKILPDPENPKTEQVEAFEYDANGNLIACKNTAIQIGRKFDAEGRLLEERQGHAFSITNEYDRDGNRTSRITTTVLDGHPRPHTVRYRYDVLNQATAVEADRHAPMQLTRDALGQLTGETLGPRLTRERAYSPDGYLTAQVVSSAEPPSLLQQTFEYDRAGNLTKRIDSVFGIDAYTYNPFGRIVSHLDPQLRLQRYLDDPTGDRLRTHVRQAIPGDGANTDWRREGESEGTWYRFDRAGNLVARTGPTGRTTFTWDASQRLAESTNNGRITTYRYDPLGRRLSKTTDGVTTLFCWDGDVLLSDCRVGKDRSKLATLPGQREWIYYPETFEPLAMVLGEHKSEGANSPPPSTTLYLYHNDPNGCPTRMLDTSGQTVWAAQYCAWGTVKRLHVNRVDNPIRMQGQYCDAETVLHYNRFRYYDSCGQFISQDPLGVEAGISVYQFAPNVGAWIDPLGLTCQARLKNRTIEVHRPGPGGKSSWQPLVTIPPGATRRKLHPVPGGATRGFEYKWNDGTHTWRVRIHDADPSAPLGSNAHSGWVARVQRGSQFADDMGHFHPPGIQNKNSPFHNPTAINDTHIPIQERQRFPR